MEVEQKPLIDGSFLLKETKRNKDITTNFRNREWSPNLVSARWMSHYFRIIFPCDKMHCMRSEVCLVKEIRSNSTQMIFAFLSNKVLVRPLYYVLTLVNLTDLFNFFSIKNEMQFYLLLAKLCI